MTEKKTAKTKKVAKTSEYKNAVKGKKKGTVVVSQTYVAVMAIIIAVQTLVILVLMMALTTSLNGKGIDSLFGGEQTAQRQDRDIRHGGIIAASPESGNIGEHVRGKKDSKVVFIWYTDMQCPACAQMWPIIEALYAKYSDKVAFVTRYLPLNMHPYARPASIALESADAQGYYYEMMSALFTRRNDWVYVSDEDMLADRFDEIFKEASGGKGDGVKFREGLNREEYGKKVDHDMKLAREDSLTSTPTVFIDGREIDFANASEGASTAFINAIEDALNK